MKQTHINCIRLNHRIDCSSGHKYNIKLTPTNWVEIMNTTIIILIPDYFSEQTASQRSRFESILLSGMRRQVWPQQHLQTVADDVASWSQHCTYSSDDDVKCDDTQQWQHTEQRTGRPSIDSSLRKTVMSLSQSAAVTMWLHRIFLSSWHLRARSLQ